MVSLFIIKPDKSIIEYLHERIEDSKKKNHEIKSYQIKTDCMPRLWKSYVSVSSSFEFEIEDEYFTYY